MNPRFSLRDLGWLTIVAAILLRWYLGDPLERPRNKLTLEVVQATESDSNRLGTNQPYVVLIHDETSVIPAQAVIQLRNR